MGVAVEVDLSLLVDALSRGFAEVMEQGGIPQDEAILFVVGRKEKGLPFLANLSASPTTSMVWERASISDDVPAGSPLRG